ncbi:CDIF630_02480 family spore surface protein [Clostridium aminobutyricum]|uniref:DUF3787 domain-containing protein n=1 Tax=Clostridium aminobutyricum TaxID=33953 RepID=A0A939D7H5_CLOAM|nr:DUF3787 domain-containing protein [Clostridium aminobutyricum]MBN7772506.1 DUF3787 domain-containing protein [Clostridium aminobutyricum]
MDKKLNNTLTGFENERLNSVSATNSEYTAAWSNVDEINRATNLSITSEYSVEKAKNWVDNGSQL